MSKEMFIASSPHETKLAVLDDDQLVEVYYERDTDVGLVGGIYKGRVSRVLPGMQSAFVDIGLDRDAFLYVSDFFFEDQEDFDKIIEEAETRAVHFSSEEATATPPSEAANKEAVPQIAAPVPTSSPIPEETTPPETLPQGQSLESPAPEASAGEAEEVAHPPSAPPEPAGEGYERRPYEPRGRRWRRRGRKFSDHRQGEHKFAPRSEDSFPPPSFEILPGESLAKYSHVVPEAPGVEPEDVFPGEEDSAEASAATDQPEAESSFETAPADEMNETPTASGGTAGLDAEVETRIDAEAVAMPQESHAVSQVEPEAGAPEMIEPSVATALPEVQTQTEQAAADSSPACAEAEQEVSEPQVVEAEANPQATKTSAVEPVVESEAGESFLGESDESLGLSEEESEGEAAETAQERLEEPLGDAALGQPPELVAGADQSSGTFPELALPDQEMAAAKEAAPGMEGSTELPAAPIEGTYTVREPHQRPRFAPRRGRRGRRGGGYQGRGEAKRESRPGNNQPVQISKLLKEGQEILVQISKEPLGTKGARITSHIALPGRYLVYMPTVDHIGVSRKIVSEEERLRLRNIILENKGALNGGFIVRTAAQDRSEEELKTDLKSLSTLWNEIRSKAERAKAPALIHRDLDLVQRILRDTLTPEFKSVRVDNETEYERVLEFVNRSQPSLIGKVKLYSRDTPLFEEFGIDAEIEKALKPKVWLKSGGYIVINQTEALVAIDVNTGKYVGKTNRLEDTILKTNVDAVNEIVRQVRLRDLGGIIVIDFIDMDERKNRAKVVQALEEALHKDRAPTKVIAFHDFGLVAITRKRVKQSLERTLCERCNYCSGSGWVKSPITVCHEILAEARRMSSQIEGKVMTLRVNPEVAKVLKSRDGMLVSELEALTQKDIILKSDPAVHQERFEIF